ncbi:MAG: hypothetical protein ACK4MQ_00440 [Hyphomonas sp.]
MSRNTIFDYRAWPAEGLPHVAALHCLFGVGMAEIRTDTYIFSPARPDWQIILHGGTEIEIHEKAEADAPLSGWRVLAHSEFPLRRSVVRTLQEAFPAAQLSRRIVLPGDVISCLDSDAEIFTVCKRTVQFHRDGCVAEVTQFDADDRRAETFSLTSKRADTVMDALAMLPAPRLPNMDYGAWLKTSPWTAPAIRPARPYQQPLIMGAARIAC